MRSWFKLVTLCWVLSATSAAFANDYVRGDTNSSGDVNVADVVFALAYLFQGGSADCLDAIDVNDDGQLDVSDPVGLLNYLFLAGSIPAPFPDCGPDPTTDALDCAVSSCIAPADLAYDDASPVYFLGAPIVPNLPTSSGGAADLYVIAPDLPDGLEIDPDTGVISGASTELWPATDHVVIASNGSGSVFTTVNVTVVDDPPAGLGYSNPDASYVVAQPIVDNVPTSTGGPILSYSIAPDLPDGLELDPATGVISGIPTEASPATDHAIIGVNPGGSTFTTVTLRVIDPSSISNSFELGPPLETPRYAHTATSLPDGRVLVVGGSDENQFTSLDSAELFDSSITSGAPGAVLGGFISTNFVGDPITMVNGGRLFHTSTLLPDGTVLVAGGAFDILIANPIPQAEVFDPELREFNPSGLEPINDMIVPRFRHTATVLASGKVLFAGGQESVDETIIDPNFPPGSPFFQFDITVFPTVREVETWDPSSRAFELAVDIVGNPTELQTPRGRAMHSANRIAGFDGVLGTVDDIVLIAGGFQTLSGVFAPDLKFPGAFGVALQTSLEFYEVGTGVVSIAQGISLSGRVNGSLVNLGTFGEQTWDGEGGLANVVLQLNGDDDGASCGNSVIGDEVIVATFTGFGPSNGIAFFQPQGVTQLQGIESAATCGTTVGRTLAPGIALAHRRVRNGAAADGTWVFTAGGISGLNGPTCVQDLIGCESTIQGGHLFDPQYNAEVDPPWNLAATRSTQNPTGVRGTWLRTDGAIPDDSLSGFGDPSSTVTLLSPRSGHTLAPIPGPDGIPGTADDFVLVVGGGGEYWGVWGDVPVSISSEIYAPPTPAP